MDNLFAQNEDLESRDYLFRPDGNGIASPRHLKDESLLFTHRMSSSDQFFHKSADVSALSRHQVLSR